MNNPQLRKPVPALAVKRFVILKVCKAPSSEGDLDSRHEHLFMDQTNEVLRLSDLYFMVKFRI